MKQLFSTRILQSPIRVASIVLVLSAGLFSCADKMTDKHSEMSGGHESGTTGGLGDERDLGGSYNRDGTGKPVAGGRVNVLPDSLGYHDSTKVKPF
jgi:hypothetical protein